MSMIKWKVGDGTSNTFVHGRHCKAIYFTLDDNDISFLESMERIDDMIKELRNNCIIALQVHLENNHLRNRLITKLRERGLAVRGIL